LEDEASDDEPGFGDTIRLALVDRMRRNLIDYYGEMQAIELLFVEAAEALDGEDPAIPEIRAILDWMRAELEELRGDLRDRHQVDIALPDLDPSRLATIKRIAHWPEKRVGMAESIQIKLDKATSGQGEDQPDHDPEAAPSDGE
jgi:hypothetical protein